MKAKKYILLLLSLLLVCSAAYSQRKYIVKKGDTPWSVAKAMLKKDSVANPTSGEVLYAIDLISEANGCKNSDDLRTKFFSEKTIARGAHIMIPLDLKMHHTPVVGVENNDEDEDGDEYDLFGYELINPSITTAFAEALFGGLLTGFLGLDESDNNNEKKETEIKQDISAPKESPSIVTDKTMTFIQMVKRPFGVLPENSKGKTMEEIEKELAQYPIWKISKSGISSDLEVKSTNGYDMRFLNVVPERADCSFKKSTSTSELTNFRYSFSFDKKKDAESFREKVLTELKSIGSQIENNYYGTDDVKAEYGNSYILVSYSKNTKIVRITINYM